jgi:hypothetical protein
MNATCAGGVSSGIEPVYASEYSRRIQCGARGTDVARPDGLARNVTME